MHKGISVEIKYHYGLHYLRQAVKTSTTGHRATPGKTKNGQPRNSSTVQSIPAHDASLHPSTINNSSRPWLSNSPQRILCSNGWSSSWYHPSHRTESQMGLIDGCHPPGNTTSDTHLYDFVMLYLLTCHVMINSDKAYWKAIFKEQRSFNWSKLEIDWWHFIFIVSLINDGVNATM